MSYLELLKSWKVKILFVNFKYYSVILYIFYGCIGIVPTYFDQITILNIFFNVTHAIIDILDVWDIRKMFLWND